MTYSEEHHPKDSSYSHYGTSGDHYYEEGEMIQDYDHDMSGPPLPPPLPPPPPPLPPDIPHKTVADSIAATKKTLEELEKMQPEPQNMLLFTSDGKKKKKKRKRIRTKPKTNEECSRNNHTQNMPTVCILEPKSEMFSRQDLGEDDHGKHDEYFAQQQRFRQMPQLAGGGNAEHSFEPAHESSALPDQQNDYNSLQQMFRSFGSTTENADNTVDSSSDVEIVGSYNTIIERKADFKSGKQIDINKKIPSNSDELSGHHALLTSDQCSTSSSRPNEKTLAEGSNTQTSFLTSFQNFGAEEMEDDDMDLSDGSSKDDEASHNLQDNINESDITDLYDDIDDFGKGSLSSHPGTFIEKNKPDSHRDKDKSSTYPAHDSKNTLTEKEKVVNNVIDLSMEHESVKDIPFQVSVSANSVTICSLSEDELALKRERVMLSLKKRAAEKILQLKSKAIKPDNIKHVAKLTHSPSPAKEHTQLLLSPTPRGKIQLHDVTGLSQRILVQNISKSGPVQKVRIIDSCVTKSSSSKTTTQVHLGSPSARDVEVTRKKNEDLQKKLSNLKKKLEAKRVRQQQQINQQKKSDNNVCQTGGVNSEFETNTSSQKVQILNDSERTHVLDDNSSSQDDKAEGGSGCSDNKRVNSPASAGNVESLRKRQRELQQQIELSNLRNMVSKQKELLFSQRVKLSESTQLLEMCSKGITSEEKMLHQSTELLSELEKRRAVMDRMHLTATKRLVNSRRRLHEEKKKLVSPITKKSNRAGAADFF